MKKVFTFLFCLIYLFSITTVQAVEISSTITNWQSKLDSQLMEAMETATEKIPVWLWMEDIDQTEVKEKVYQNTGLKESNLSVVKEDISDELVADLTNYTQLDTQSQQAVQNEMQSYLDRTKTARNLEAQRVDTYLQQLRSTQDDMLSIKNQTIYSQLGFSTDDILIEQTGAPMYVVQLTKDEIIKAAKSPKVTAIYYYDTTSVATPEDNDSLTYSLNATTIKLVRDLGLTGSGIKLGVIDGGKVITTAFLDSSPIDDSRVIQLSSSAPYVFHSTYVAEIAAGNYGVAPSASIYSSAVSDDNTLIDSIVAQSLQGVTVANYSMGDPRDGVAYTPQEIYIDYITKNKNFTLVKSSGNIMPPERDDEEYITSPGLAYNVITVGGYFNGGTEAVENDVMFAQSRYDHLEGCVKPDFISNQVKINNEETSTGTSYAAPVVTGIVALLFELRPSLQTQPEAVKAILMASCHRRVKLTANGTAASMTSGLDNYQGTGAVDPYIAIAIAGSGHYGIRNVPGNDSQETIQFYQPKYNATGLNVSIAWSVTNPTPTTQGTPINLNMSVINNGVTMGTSALQNSSSEMVYVTPSATNKNYAIQITNNSDTTNPVRYAYAYSINTQKYEYTDITEGVFYLKNKATGKYLTLNSSKVAAQMSFSGGTSQQWLLSGARVNAVSSQNNRLSVGELLDNGYRKAVTNTSSGASVMFQQNTENSQWDGSVTIYRGTNDTALGIYNNSTSNGATAAWSTYNPNSEYQKWYLEPVAYQRGDINRDGSFTTADYNLAYQYVYGSSTLTDIQQFLADVNGDWEIDTADVLAINQLIP